MNTDTLMQGVVRNTHRSHVLARDMAKGAIGPAFMFLGGGGGGVWGENPWEQGENHCHYATFIGNPLNIVILQTMTEAF